MIELGVHRIRPAWFRFRHNCGGIGARGCNPRYHRGTPAGAGVGRIGLHAYVCAGLSRTGSPDLGDPFGYQVG